MATQVSQVFSHLERRRLPCKVLDAIFIVPLCCQMQRCIAMAVDEIKGEHLALRMIIDRFPFVLPVLDCIRFVLSQLVDKYLDVPFVSQAHVPVPCLAIHKRINVVLDQSGPRICSLLSDINQVGHLISDGSLCNAVFILLLLTRR